MFEDSEYNKNFHRTDSIKKWFHAPEVTQIISNDVKCLTMHKFRLKHLQVKEVQDTLKRISMAAKITKMQYEDLNFYSTECKLIRSQKFYFGKMREAAKEVPVTGLLLDWEECIYKLTNKSQLCEKFSHIFEELMQEIKEKYYETMHDTAVQQIIAIKYEVEEDLIAISPYKYPGRTEFMTKFLRNRCIFVKQYYLSHRFIRSIVTKAYYFLPEKFCDLGRHRSFNFFDPEKLFDFMGIELKKSAHIVTASYYGDIIRSIFQRRYIQDIPLNILERFIKCATTLLGLQIISRIINTIEHLLIILADHTKIPLLKLELRYEHNNLFINPRLEKLYATFHDVINDIANIARYLPPLQSWIRFKDRRKGENVNIAKNDKVLFAAPPNWYIDDVHQRLDVILKKSFQPLTDYMQELEIRFSSIIHYKADKAENDAITVHVDKKQFLEEHVARVEDYNELIRSINGMPDNEFLVMTRLCQINAKRELVIHANELRDLVIDEIVKHHWDYNLEICGIFETLKDRALDVPQTTRELLELGQYMLEATSTLMIELQEKIALSLRMMSSLIEMTTLSRHHVQLNTTTVQWLKRIKPIFERSGAMYEQMKFELEEKLEAEVIILNKRVEDMFPRLIMMDDMSDAKRIKEYIEDMRQIVHQLESMEKKAEWINAEESLFNFPLSVYPRINELKDIILPFYALIYRAHQWERDYNVWLDGPFEFLDVQLIEDKLTQYLTDFSKTSKQYKTTIKMQTAMNYPYRFAGFVDDADPFQQPVPLKLCYQLIEDVKWFKQYFPLLAIFRNPAILESHWDEMSAIAMFDLAPNAGTTFRKIIHMDLMKELEKYEVISISATREMANKMLLQKLKSEWDEIIFTLMLYKDTKVPILTALEDILMMLDEHIVKIQAMRGSAFVKIIEGEVNAFYALLLRVQSTIDEWIKIQVQWMYFLPIFSSKDIVMQLPNEEILFIQIDALFRKTMQITTKEPRVLITAGAIGLLENMKEGNIMMEKVNRGVLNYLEEKRLFFPRFFFLSNDDMFEILSETKEPLRVQPHLKKCFEGINRLGFDVELQIFSMIGDDKEEVLMKDIVSTEAARGCVERWLLEVETQMLTSIREETYLSYLDYDVTERNVWILNWPGMVIISVAQIYWSFEVQNCLVEHATFALEMLHEKLKAQILKLVELVRGPLSKQNRTTLNALITIDVHGMDVVRSLIEKQISNALDFDWLAQLRYYWEDDVYVRIIYYTVKYAYEYIGNCSRLVITPLTDRCYRTLIAAYSLHLNGAPEGPAGTGKTETAKDLSKAIAVQCVVFNCSDGLDYKNMGKFFKGLICCGAWACFDEFNRIELEVLSVIAQQILSIIQAVRAELETFVFEDTLVRLNPNIYVCITMNPGYAGRSELPDNLKVLFRTVAMMVPDYSMIAEIFLYSSGFGNARELAIKIVITYKLCSEQLSAQSHYDYGMRAVKSVLSAAQNLKLNFPMEDESILLLRSLIDVNLPKFLSRDIQLFQVWI